MFASRFAGKMAVQDCVSKINLLDLTKCLANVRIGELNIISINLSPKKPGPGPGPGPVDKEMFIINDSSPKVTFLEIGVLSFI